MNKLDPNINSIKVNPLTVTKPEYKDPTIEDIYLDRGKEEYIYGKGYIENYDVIVVKRITPDMVRKFAYSFTSRNEAVNFMRSLYHLDDVETHLQEEETIMDKDIDEEEKACTTEIKEPTNKNFSFGDDDYINKQEEPQKIEPKEEKPRAKFEFGDEDDLEHKYNKIPRYDEIPDNQIQETGTNKPIKFGNVQIGKGIL